MNLRIDWTELTWNPVRARSAVSPGCDQFHAARLDIRFFRPNGRYAGLAKMMKGGPKWTGEVVLAHDALLRPLTSRIPRTIFVNSLPGFFHPELSTNDIDAVLGVKAAANQHSFQVIAKRADRLSKWTQTPSARIGLRRRPGGPRWRPAETRRRRRP